MLNKEYYAKEIIEITTAKDNFILAVDKHTKKPCKCSETSCRRCLFGYCGSCLEKINKWANSEHIEPIKLTLAEKIVLENLDSNFKWIARDDDGKLSCYVKKPNKIYDMWFSNCFCDCPFEKLFKFIKWEDEEPYRIEDILSNCEVIEDVD